MNAMIRRLIHLALSAFLAIGTAAGDDPYPIDEDEIRQEIAALCKRVGDVEPKAAEKARKLVAEGTVAYDRHDYEKALELFGKALEKNPTDAIAQYELALTLHAMGDGLRALEAVIRATALGPELGLAYVLRASIEDDLGYLDRSLATYDRLLEKDPHSYPGHLNKAITLMRQGEIAEAEAHLHRPLEIDPRYPSAYLKLAQAAAAQGFGYDEEKWLRKFLEVGPEDPRAAGVRARLEEMSTHQISMSPDAEFPDVELLVRMARAQWSGEKHQELNPEARGYRLTLEEEQEVLQGLLLGAWREKKKKDPDVAHPYYDLLLKIDDAGYFEEYVYHQRRQELGEVARDWLERHPERVEAFLDWARSEGLTDEDEDDGKAKDEGEPAAESDEAAVAEGTAPEDQAVVLEERDLPDFVLAVLEASEVIYDLGLEEEAPDFFERERRRWRRFELDGEDRVECDFDLRKETESSYRAELRPIIAWARCFDPEDEEWEDLKIAQRFGRIFRDLAPDVRGIVERTRDGVKVRVDPETRWTGYLLFKAAWLHEPMVRKTAGQGVGPEPSVSEEVLAFTTLVAGYESSLAPEDGEEPAEPDPYFEELRQIRDAGLLRAFVLFEVLHKRYGVSLQRLDPESARLLEQYLGHFVFPPRATSPKTSTKE